MPSKGTNEPDYLFSVVGVGGLAKAGKGKNIIAADLLCNLVENSMPRVPKLWMLLLKNEKSLAAASPGLHQPSSNPC